MMDDAPAVGLVLAAVDASAASVETVEVAAAVAARYEADLHVVHMLGGTDIDGLTSGALDPATVAAEQVTDIIINPIVPDFKTKNFP